MSSTEGQGSSNAPNITIQTMQPDGGPASMPGNHMLLQILTTCQSPPKPVGDIISFEVVEHYRVRRDKTIENGELSIKELQKAAQGGEREFGKKIMLTLGLGTTELSLTFHLSVEGTPGTSSSATGNPSACKNANIKLMQVPVQALTATHISHY
ncbi:hypothetical protein L218DRAFT_948099 [Marasmius fiardii PR-910]|nr:hypothetical protein L218DRAFT_948099 [Marasmius fiardii PR-910]